MKGLELSRKYYEEVGLPLLKTEFAAEFETIAVGLVGDGSDCLGFDDKFSTDHDWGPGFCCWLRQEDFQVFGERLRAAYARLPAAFLGHERKTSEWGDNRVGVFEIGAFYRSFLGRQGMPANLAEWMRLPEANLAACTSGEVFRDPPGEFSRIRAQLLAHYPDDVRLAKIAARCMSAGQAGQYNFHRSIWRGEYYAAQHAETKFCADAMSIVYLLNRRYAPFYKWVHRGLAGLPRLGRFVAQKVNALIASPEYENKKQLIAEIAEAIVLELQEEGLSDAEGPFLVDHGPQVHARIADPGLRQLNVWVG
jgi:hypothetical protein